MQVAILLVGVVALLFALIKGGGANVIGDVLVIAVIVVAFGALYKFAQPHLEASAPAQQQQPAAFQDLKFFNMYAKIKSAITAMDFVKNYNEGDFVRLARDVDDFVKGYQELYGTATRLASQKIDLLLDKRADILDTIQSFFVCAPNAERDGILRKQLLVVQSITYHMVKKVQQKYRTKRLMLPAAAGS